LHAHSRSTTGRHDLPLSIPALAAAPAVARPSHRPTAALGNLRGVVGGEGVRGAVVVPATGGPAHSDEGGQGRVVGGLGIGGLPSEHPLAHGVQVCVDAARVNIEGEGATVLVAPEPLGASVGPAGPDVGPAFGTGAVEEDERGCGVGREVHRRSEKPRGPRHGEQPGASWRRALLVAGGEPEPPLGDNLLEDADSGRRVMYPTRPGRWCQAPGQGGASAAGQAPEAPGSRAWRKTRILPGTRWPSMQQVQLSLLGSLNTPNKWAEVSRGGQIPATNAFSLATRCYL